MSAEHFWGKRSRRIASIIGAVSAGGALLCWIFAPQAAAPASRFAIFACLQPAIGSLILALIFRITGGQWGESLRPYFGAAIRLLPWIWPLAIPFVLIQAAHPTGAAAAVSGPATVAALLVRAVFYEAIFIGAGAIALGRAPRSWAGPGLLALVFSLHVLAADWFFTLEPGWYSSGFPLAWMSLQAASGLSWAIAAAIASGLDPAANGEAGRPVGLDWGNLLLTTVILSTYLLFMEFLIIWSGNLPREITWYLRRSTGGWRALISALALFHLAVPFAALLSRRVKQDRRALGRLAFVVGVVEVLWNAWFVLPAFGDRGAMLGLACVCTLAAGSAFFVIGYFAGLEPRPSSV